MSQLFFTSSLMPNEKFLSFEQLFKHIDPKDTLFVFDANLVVYYRDLFLNSRKFISNEANKGIYYSIRYLIEQIARYDLEVNASIGVEESCRYKSNFKINTDKLNQTHRAVMNLLHMDIHTFDKFIDGGYTEKAIVNNDEYNITKIDCLHENSTFKNLIIISYLSSLKIFQLQNKIDRDLVSPSKAYLELLDFMMLEVDCIAGTVQMFALHLFGGILDFKSMLFSKGNATKEEKLHKIFNGSIDLIYPYMVNKAQETYPIPNISKKLIPVFVTLDKRLATLHSLLNTKLIMEAENESGKNNYNPELTEIGFLKGLNWKPNELELFKERVLKDLPHRLKSAFSGPKESNHLIPLVKEYENIILGDFRMKEW